MREPDFAWLQAVTAADLAQAGLLRVAGGCSVSPHALFIPADAQGVTRPVEIGESCTIAPFAVIYGGAVIGDGTRVEEHAVIGKPEQGYAVGHTYPGAGAATTVGPGVIIRAAAITYAGAEIGTGTVIGHGSVIRSFAVIGEHTQLGHNLTVERQARIGSWVRCSPGTHITSSCVLADRVFLGAGVRTVNDRFLVWGDPDQLPELLPPAFRRGARVGSGATVLSGVTVGEDALVGAGSVVTKDVPAGTVAYGVPARVRGDRTRKAS